MTTRHRRSSARVGAAVLAIALGTAACTDGGGEPEPTENTAPTPETAGGECGELTLAYNPDNGFEASTFIVGRLAHDELGCKVTYLKTNSRKGWRLVASGAADAYLDAYGSPDLAAELAGSDGPVTVVGPNGIRGGVDLLAPFFFTEYGIETSRDLPDVPPTLFGSPGPRIFTVPALLPLASSFVEFQELDFRLRNYVDTHPSARMGDLLDEPRNDDDRRTPNFYLVAAPLAFLGPGPGRLSVQIPGSAASLCEPDESAALCSLDDFEYQKIVNSEFSRSGSPAYNLIYNFRLSGGQASTILELVELSGYDVGEADMVSWINTHERNWQRWLQTP